jgi:beta-phosphoglucomutase-like phosphatase (HAD superfamily)
LLGLDPAHCLAIEDSVTGAASAEAAGCPVLVVPNDVEVPATPRRHHVISLADVDPDRLLAIYDALQFDPQPTA